MLLPPLSIILSWPKPNYENPEQQGHFMAPLIIVMMVFCGIVVSLRLYVRAFILKAFKADDWLIILATSQNGSDMVFRDPVDIHLGCELDQSLDPPLLLPILYYQILQGLNLDHVGIHRCLDDHLITDVLVLLLPIPTVWRLQMPTRQKITLVGVFTLGIVAPLSAILRLIYIQKATVSWDQSWWCIELWIYTSLETHVAIICASIPSLKPLAIKIFPRFASSHGYSNNLTPMEFNSSGAGSSAVRGTHSRAQAGNSNHSRAERAAKVRSIYPLTTFGKDERGESQESIVANIGESRGSLDIITSFSSGGTPPKARPRVGTVVKTTEVTRDVTMRDKRRLGDDRNV